MAAPPVVAMAVLLLLLQLASLYPSVVLADAVLGRKAGLVVMDDDEPAAENRLAPAGPPPGRYAVIFDAGSTGTRMHVFRFDNKMDLVGIGHGIEFFAKVFTAQPVFLAQEPAASTIMHFLENSTIMHSCMDTVS